MLQHGWNLKHFKWKKPITEDHILQDPIYIKYSDIQNSQICKDKN